jgi:hypothetical protein
MFDEPAETPSERSFNPADRARDKSDEFRMHAELAAVFEGGRKFDAQIVRLDPEIAREVQRTMGRLEKSTSREHPVLPEASVDDARRLLTLPSSSKLSTNDYHVHHRPGETMIVRWLAGVEVESFYERLQAHFDVALKQFREEERQSLGWKQEPGTLKYLEALDAIEIKMPDRYLRPIIKQHNLFVLSTQTADEMNIVHLCDYLMGVDAKEVVGRASAPPEDSPTEHDLAWFFKLFSLRGMDGQTERMCFFTYLQKAEESAW